MPAEPPEPNSSEPSERPAVRRASLPYTRQDALSDALDRFRLPLLFVGILALIGGSRFEATRPIEAMFMALAAAPVALIAAALSIRESRPGLRAAAFTLVGITLLLSETSVAGALFAFAPRPFIVPGAALISGILGVAAVCMEAALARHGIKTRFAAAVGIALTLALYLPAHFDQKEPFGTVLAALLVALFLGGGVGLLVGAFAAQLVRR